MMIPVTRQTYQERMFEWAWTMTAIGCCLLLGLVAANHLFWAVAHQNRIDEDRVRAEQRRERRRHLATAQRNEATLARIEARHQAFCDETCRTMGMSPLMHDHETPRDWECEREGVPTPPLDKVCRCKRVGQGRFVTIERFTKNYHPMRDLLEEQ